jgi:hypothetical protein
MVSTINMYMHDKGEDRRYCVNKIWRTMSFLKFWQCLYFSFFNTQTMHIKSFYTQQHCYVCFPKNLIPWRDSSPGLLVPEADAMSTAPQRHGMDNVLVKVTVVLASSDRMNCSQYFSIVKRVSLATSADVYPLGPSSSLGRNYTIWGRNSPLGSISCCKNISGSGRRFRRVQDRGRHDRRRPPQVPHLALS